MMNATEAQVIRLLLVQRKARLDERIRNGDYTSSLYFERLVGASEEMGLAIKQVDAYEVTRERIEAIVREVADGLPDTPAWWALIERIAWLRIVHEVEMTEGPREALRVLRAVRAEGLTRT
jgi:hypothetical protein